MVSYRFSSSFFSKTVDLISFHLRSSSGLFFARAGIFLKVVSFLLSNGSFVVQIFQKVTKVLTCFDIESYVSSALHAPGFDNGVSRQRFT